MQLPLPLDELSLSADASTLPLPARRVYCNRNLRMDRIEWIGFDMDYTLAIYQQAEMDRLSIEATAAKLVDRGYPEELLAMPYRTDFPIRGLLIDKKLGHVLKMDRYKYVKKAYHGLRELTHDERRRLYHSRRLRPASQRYHWVDTLYALSEVSVYAAAIEELENHGAAVAFTRLFEDVRECIDASHQDGSILDEILAHKSRYVMRDEKLGSTLHKLRSAGKKLFLLTNSQPAYTDTMMSYLLAGGPVEYPTWKNYFDIIVTASSKPLFFTGSAPFHEVLEGGELAEAARLERGHTYAGGNIKALEAQLRSAPDRILYVGDHIYGDVLRAKKETAWRTAMIVQEMDQELEALARCREAIQRADTLEEMRDTLHHELRGRQAHLKLIQRAIETEGRERKAAPATALEVARVRHRRAIDKLRGRIRSAEAELNELEVQVAVAFHPFWGSLFKAGPEMSSFGHQIEAYACVYTERVTNLLGYSPMHYFRSPRDRMPHEL